MTEKVQENVVESNMTIGIYTIYDCVLKQFDVPFAIQDNKLCDYLTIIANDVQSRYFGHESDFIVNRIGDFNTTTGEIEPKFVERICILDSYIDKNKRNLQTIIQTLNYLPSGYFKMPEEMKQGIQENINSKVQEYVENYIVPDLDVQKCKQELSKVE